MVYEKPTPELHAGCSDAEMINVVMTLLDQFAKLTERNSQLTEQNCQLSEQPSLVAEQIARFQKENTTLVQRVSDFERSVGLNSGNSSKPPSSDGLAKPSAMANKRTRSLRGTSNRKSGGQPGHKGTRVKQVKNPDTITDHFPFQCQACQAALSPTESIRSAVSQVCNIPPLPPPVVTEHRVHTCQCHHCGA